MSDASAQRDTVARLIDQARGGNREALDHLFPLVYAELHAIASREMRGERPGHTLQPTALVNEAYLRLLGGKASPSWRDRTHFLSTAARAMRNVLVDHARARNSQKRGSGLRVTLEEGLAGQEDGLVDFLILEDTLTQLAEAEPRWAQVVELRFFGGLEMEEIAEMLGVSTITVSRDWRFARAWLAEKLGEAGSGGGSESG